MKNLFPTILRVLLALPLIVFGLNKFLMFANMAPPVDSTAQAFLGAMFSSYLVKLVGMVEVLGGSLLLYKRTAFWAVLLLAPVMVNIVAFHLAHDLPGNGIWLFVTVLYVAVAYQYRALFSSKFNAPTLV